MAKELNLNEVKEYLEYLKESLKVHDEECPTCYSTDKELTEFGEAVLGGYLPGVKEDLKEYESRKCEYLSTMRVEIARLQYKLDNQN